MTSHNYLKIFSNKEKKEIVEKLNEQFGIKKVEGIFLQKGAERIFLYQGCLNEKKIRELEFARLNIERVGIYFGKLVNGFVRLSIDGIHLLKEQITKNVFELDDEQFELWMRGNELLFEDLENAEKSKSDNSTLHRAGWEGVEGGFSDLRKSGEFLIIKYKNDFIGTGKASEKKITNFIPKNRRLKDKNN